MSAAEIIAELPKLTQDERVAISRRLRELEEEKDEMQFLDEALIQAMQHLDRMEAQDASRKSS